MDILVEFTEASGEMKTLQINDAPQGTELVVLEQFLAGATSTRLMVEEAAQEPQAITRGIFTTPIEVAHACGSQSLFAVRETIHHKQKEARLDRQTGNPAMISRSDYRKEHKAQSKKPKST